jgi:tetratricopeptide (TPR) repeat protein
VRFVFVFVFGLCLNASAQKKAFHLTEKGDKKLHKGDTVLALDNYYKAIASDSAFADAYAKISDVFITRGNYDEALLLLNDGIRITTSIPKDKETISHLYSIRSFIHFTAESFHLAIYDLDHAIVLNTENPNYFYMRALVKRMNGDEKGCCRDLKRAIALGMEAAHVYSKTYCN